MSEGDRRMDIPQRRKGRRMTVLPHDTHFARWQRAQTRSRALVAGLTQWCGEGHATFPDWFNLDALESRFTSVLSEMEKVMHADKENHDRRD
jgi:hypothetical protein